MGGTLVRIKQAVNAGRFRFTDKASLELDADGLTQQDALESIVNAVAIYKTIRSRSLLRAARREYLHVIHSYNRRGLPIYTKGKLVSERGAEYFYILLSSKISVKGD